MGEETAGQLKVWGGSKDEYGMEWEDRDSVCMYVRP